MSFTYGFTNPFFTGGTSTVSSRAAVTRYDVIIDGIGYMVDLAFTAQPYTHESIPLLNDQFTLDGGKELGENTLNPRDYWRRSVDSWHGGAGQSFLDHTESVRTRYRTSKGIDPWTPGQIELLHTTQQKAYDGTASTLLAVAGTHLYALRATALEYTTDVTPGSPTMTPVTDAGPDDPLVDAVSITSDGYTVWVADDNRIHYTTRGAATFDKYHTSDHVASLVVHAKGRLFTVGATSNERVIYTHAGAAGASVATVYVTHPNVDWQWTAIAGGSQAIYFAGYAGDQSAIYAATILEDGTALDEPVVVATLPSGEIVRSLVSYLDVLLIGTDDGIRTGVVNSNGSLVLGTLIELGGAPLCFEPQSRFVWYGWSNYDSVSTGLGRVDLSVFNEDQPAYASDLMATAQGAVESVVTFQNLRVFTVAGEGMWAETDTTLSTGDIFSGWLHFGLAEPKVAIKMTTVNGVGAGSYEAFLAVDGGDYSQVGIEVVTNAAAPGGETLIAPQLRGRTFETQFTLNGAATIDRWTLMTEPQPERRVRVLLPLRLHSREENRLGAVEHYDVAAERARFFDLMESRSIIVFQDFESTYNVIVDNYHWVPYEQVGAQRSWDGTLVLELKLIS